MLAYISRVAVNSADKEITIDRPTRDEPDATTLLDYNYKLDAGAKYGIVQGLNKSKPYVQHRAGGEFPHVAIVVGEVQGVNTTDTATYVRVWTGEGVASLRLGLTDLDNNAEEDNYTEGQTVVAFGNYQMDEYQGKDQLVLYYPKVETIEAPKTKATETTPVAPVAAAPDYDDIPF